MGNVHRAESGSVLKRVESVGDGIVAQDALTGVEMGDEFLLMGLRLTEGIHPTEYQALTGTPLKADRIASLMEDGLVAVAERERLRVRPQDSRCWTRSWHDLPRDGSGPGRECSRSGRYDLAAGFGYTQNSEPALIRTVGPEKPKNPINTGVTRGVGQHFG